MCIGYYSYDGDMIAQVVFFECVLRTKTLRFQVPITNVTTPCRGSALEKIDFLQRCNNDFCVFVSPPFVFNSRSGRVVLRFI